MPESPTGPDSTPAGAVSPIRFSLAGRLAGILSLGLALFAVLSWAMQTWTDWPLWVVGMIALGASMPATVAAVGRALHPLGGTLSALSDGIRSFQDHDFSVRLAAGRDDELGELVRLYNRVGEILQEERGHLRQRELLLQTALDQSPLAILLINPLDRIIYSNVEARRLFTGGSRLGGRRLSDLLESCPEEMRQIIGAAHDGIFSVEGAGRSEIYHLAERGFYLNRQQHRLLLLRRLTNELARQEAEVWKKVIRVISHEVNNSLAPISSMTHSGLIIANDPSQLHRLAPIYRSIRERVEHLSGFLEGYARFARLPKPRPERVAWRPWLDEMRRVLEFNLVGDPPEAPGHFDPAQMQQALINLLKNAREASANGAAIEVRVDRLPDGRVRVQVLDRGKGMSDDVMKRALLPFYSTKPSGSGVGLPLCREIVEAHGGALRIENRDGGGTVVSFWLPNLIGAPSSGGSPRGE